MNCDQIQDWLTHIGDLCKSTNRKLDSRKILTESALKTHILINYLNANFDDLELCQPIIAQLLALYYRLGVLRCFVLQLMPSIIHLYLVTLAKKWKKCTELFELFFLAIYNEEILEGGTGSPSMTKRVDEIRIPSVTRFPSVYHDPSRLVATSDSSKFTAASGGNALACVQNTVRIGPYPAVDRIIAENRYIVLTRILRVVNNTLSQMCSEVVCRHLCLSLTSICKSGFSFGESDFRQRVLGEDASDELFGDFARKPRVVVSSYFLIESLNGVNYALFNGHADVALRALEAIHRRAHFEIFPDVLLQTNALRNSLLDTQTVRMLFDSQRK